MCVVNMAKIVWRARAPCCQTLVMARRSEFRKHPWCEPRPWVRLRASGQHRDSTNRSDPVETVELIDELRNSNPSSHAVKTMRELKDDERVAPVPDQGRPNVAVE